MTITFKPQEQERLAAAAEAMGISTEMLVREAVEEKLATVPREADRAKDARPIWEFILDTMKDVPVEVLERIPKDGASQLDHYLYGHAKKEQ